VTDGASPARSGVSNVPRLKVNRDPEKEQRFLKRPMLGGGQLDQCRGAGPLISLDKLSGIAELAVRL